MNGIGRTSGLLATAGVLVLALLVVPALAAPAEASPVPLGASNTQQWAYGAEKWVNVTINLPNATYTQTAFFGWQVVFTATNTSATTQAWEVQRTMMGSFYANYCQPACSNATTFGNLSVVGREQDTGFANLTTTAVVYENGVATAAVGLSNASFENSANLTESLRYTLSQGLLTGSGSSAFDVAGTAHGSVDFAPSLGLAPLNLTNSTSWNSSAAFTSNGAWAVQYFVAHTPIGGHPTSSSGNASATIAHNGTVALWGTDHGTVTLANGVTVPVVVLVWTGPFDDVDGVILIPHDFDLFGDGAHSWNGNLLGAENVATSNLDIAFDAGHHLRVVASAAAYGSVDDQFGLGSSAPAGPGPMATTSSPTVVQAQPESVSEAQQNAACLAGSCSTSSTHPVAGAILALLVVGVVAAHVVVGVLAYLRFRRGGATMAPAGSASVYASTQPPQGAVDPTSPSAPR